MDCVSFFLTVACYLASYSTVKVRTIGITDPVTTEITINFLLPMRHNIQPASIVVTPELPTTTVNYTAHWLTGSILMLRVEQTGSSQGQLLRWRVDGASTIIPLVRKSASGKYRPQVPLKLLNGVEKSRVPSRGPVPINFNTPVSPDKETVISPVPGKLQPVRFIYAGKEYTDFSRWLYFPDYPLKNDSTYRIALQPGLRSLCGTILGTRQELVFTTAKALRVLRTIPSINEKGLSLYRKLEFTMDQEILSASVTVTDPGAHITLPGTTVVRNHEVVFIPARCFLPGKSYKVNIKAESKNRELLSPYEFSFSTVDIGNRFWVDVKLGDIHTVTVYRGATLVRHMPASGGKDASPTPTGYFVTQDSGFSFWSPRFGEGATYWVRLMGQILVHSVPRDHQWKTKDDEHAKLGLPASHGCIRLDEKDARWFYENIPMGTQVIIHQ